MYQDDFIYRILSAFKFLILVGRLCTGYAELCTVSAGFSYFFFFRCEL